MSLNASECGGERDQPSRAKCPYRLLIAAARLKPCPPAESAEPPTELTAQLTDKDCIPLPESTCETTPARYRVSSIQEAFI